TAVPTTPTPTPPATATRPAIATTPAIAMVLLTATVPAPPMPMRLDRATPLRLDRVTPPRPDRVTPPAETRAIAGSASAPTTRPRARIWATTACAVLVRDALARHPGLTRVSPAKDGSRGPSLSQRLRSGQRNKTQNETARR